MENLRINRLVLAGWVGIIAAGPAGAADPGSADQTSPAEVPASTSNQSLPAPARELPVPRGQRDLTAVPAENARPGKWNFSARAAAELTFTNNVALAPPGQEESDLILGLSLPLGVRRAGPRTLFLAEYIPTVYLYARNRESDYLQNNLRSFLSVEAVDDFFFVDAIANSYPTYVSPFLPRPGEGASISENRTQQTTLGFSPYIRHETPRGWSYLLRNDNFWNGYSDAELASSFASRLFADIQSPPTRLNYGFDYTYLYTNDQAQPSAYYQQVGRVRPTLRATRTLTVSGRLGYESNDYLTPRYTGAVYGAGIVWTPNPRTRLDGYLEHRFFGSAYDLNLNYRTRRTVWKLRGTRNTATPLEQPLAQRPITTAELLDDAYRVRTADPTKREEEVRQFLANAGLPPSLTQPYSFYTDQVYVSSQWSGAVAVLGRRNTVELSAYWQDNEPITTGGNASPLTAGFQPFRQQGFALNFIHRLSGLTSVTLTASRLYTKPTNTDTSAAGQDETTLDSVRLALTRQLGEKTDGSIGVRWQNFDSLTDPYRELAFLAALAHSF